MPCEATNAQTELPKGLITPSKGWVHFSNSWGSTLIWERCILLNLSLAHKRLIGMGKLSLKYICLVMGNSFESIYASNLEEPEIWTDLYNWENIKLNHTFFPFFWTRIHAFSRVDFIAVKIVFLTRFIR